MTYISTGNGIMSLEDPQPDQVVLREVARSLSNQARFTGHTDRHYSIAEHSVYCAMAAQYMCMSEHTQRQALLHDAQEAYMGGISRPLKSLLGPELTLIEASLWRAVAVRFRVSVEIDACVWEIDDRMLMTEVRHFHGKAQGSHWPDVKPFEREVLSIRQSCTPEEAYQAFMAQARRLNLL